MGGVSTAEILSTPSPTHPHPFPPSPNPRHRPEAGRQRNTKDNTCSHPSCVSTGPVSSVSWLRRRLLALHVGRGRDRDGCGDRAGNQHGESISLLSRKGSSGAWGGGRGTGVAPLRERAQQRITHMRQRSSILHSSIHSPPQPSVH